MTATRRPAVPLSQNARCYRLTGKGRACVEFVESQAQTLGSLSRHMHDVLVMCGSGMWFDQLRQFMPPRSLDDSLRALLALDLIEPAASPQLDLDLPGEADHIERQRFAQRPVAASTP
jgi:hypothetical protein